MRFEALECNWLRCFFGLCVCAENSKVISKPQLLDILRLRGTLLKRPANLPFDDGDGSKR